MVMGGSLLLFQRKGYRQFCHVFQLGRFLAQAVLRKPARAITSFSAACTPGGAHPFHLINDRMTFQGMSQRGGRTVSANLGLIVITSSPVPCSFDGR
jgi:hypothetical protein